MLVYYFLESDSSSVGSVVLWEKLEFKKEILVRIKGSFHAHLFCPQLPPDSDRIASREAQDNQLLWELPRSISVLFPISNKLFLVVPPSHSRRIWEVEPYRWIPEGEWPKHPGHLHSKSGLRWTVGCHQGSGQPPALCRCQCLRS